MAYFTSQDGLRLAYDDQGAGVALLCLAGLTRNMDDFVPVLDGFKDRARIIRMDFRGRGRSEFAADPMSYTVLQEARDVLGLLDHLGVERVAILGTSRGGLVAMMLAALAKPRLLGVFLNDIGPEIMPEGLEAIMGYIGRAPAFDSYASAAAAMPALNPSFHDVPPATWDRHVRALWREEGGRLHLRYDPKLREAVAAGFDPQATPPDLWPLFDALEGLPLAVLRGAGSNILSDETAKKMRARRPDMRFVELTDRGHVPFLDEPAAQQLITAFLGDVE